MVRLVHRSLSSGSTTLSQFSASLGVFFKVPEQGMTEYNILARCTATPLRPTKVNGPVRFLVAAHTATPWVFPHFYPKPWLLEFVNETHVRYCVELRQPSSGTVLGSYELSRPLRHPTRDIAALRFANERQAINDIRAQGIPFSPLALRTHPLGAGNPIDLVGYEVVQPTDDGANSREKLHHGNGERGGGGGGDEDEDSDDIFRSFKEREDPTMLMSRSRGFLVARTAHQSFVKTDTKLNAGMCGGAVLDFNLECCGCVEGVVPTAPPGADIPDDVRLLQGAACMVESTEIAEFLHDDDVFDF